MAAAVAIPQALPSRSTTPPPTLTLNTSSRGTPAAVPNKHIPICSPGPRPDHGLNTPPASPPNKDSLIDQTSLLNPPDAYERLSDDFPLYSITAAAVSKAVEHYASQPLPDPKQVFPWLHGLHPENQMQLTFFVQRRKALRKTPKCIRGITIVKAGGDLSHSKLRGSIAPDEFVCVQTSDPARWELIESDPRDGFGVRNFQIQACKMATVSDIIVYGDDQTEREDVIRLALNIAAAQKAWMVKCAEIGNECQSFSTFVVSGECGCVTWKHCD